MKCFFMLVSLKISFDYGNSSLPNFLITWLLMDRLKSHWHTQFLYSSFSMHKSLGKYEYIKASLYYQPFLTRPNFTYINYSNPGVDKVRSSEALCLTGKVGFSTQSLHALSKTYFWFWYLIDKFWLSENVARGVEKVLKRPADEKICPSCSNLSLKQTNLTWHLNPYYMFKFFIFWLNTD
jgi:hypothetical protein